MSDYSVNGALHQTKRVTRLEFSIYFALIFSVALPFHLIRWAFQTLRHGKLPRLSPFARAWKDGQAVTPMIVRG
jgi:hypothetical protein